MLHHCPRVRRKKWTRKIWTSQGKDPEKERKKMKRTGKSGKGFVIFLKLVWKAVIYSSMFCCLFKSTSLLHDSLITGIFILKCESSTVIRIFSLIISASSACLSCHFTKYVKLWQILSSAS